MSTHGFHHFYQLFPIQIMPSFTDTALVCCICIAHWRHCPIFYSFAYSVVQEHFIICPYYESLKLNLWTIPQWNENEKKLQWNVFEECHSKLSAMSQYVHANGSWCQSLFNTSVNVMSLLHLCCYLYLSTCRPNPRSTEWRNDILAIHCISSKIAHSCKMICISLEKISRVIAPVLYSKVGHRWAAI